MRKDPIPSSTFLILTVAFVTSLMVSNLIAGKLISVGGLVLPAATVLFPLAYQYSQSTAKEAWR